MKINHVTTHLTGGAAKACLRLHQGLNELTSVYSTVLHRKKSKIYHMHTISYQIYGLQYFSIKFFYLKQRIKNLFRTDIETFETPYTPFRINRQKVNKNSDIIHLHWTSDFLDYNSFFNECQKPIVWTLHDMQPFTGGYPYNYNFPFRKYQKYIEKNIQTKIHVFEHVNLHIVCLCSWMENLSKNSTVFNKFPHYIIPNGVDSTIFKRWNKSSTLFNYQLPTDKKIILFIADNLNNKRKGMAHLINALEEINSSGIVVCVIGKHTKEFDSIPNLRSLGYITNDVEIAKLYSAADVLILPSLDDNLPNTAIESLCCGTPIVGYKIGGIPDIIIEGVNGLLAPRGDYIKLASLITQALKTKWNRSYIREMAIKKYDTSVQINKYLHLYNSILDTN